MAAVSYAAAIRHAAKKVQNKRGSALMARNTYDIIVVGSGPAGESAAINAAKHGKKVALISDREQVGGNCTHLGTIPSKALRHYVKQIMQFRSNPLLREFATLHKPSFPEIIRHANRVIDEQVYLRSRYYEKNDVTIIHGQAVFNDANSIRVSTKGPLLKADNFIVATGSRPYRPENVNFGHARLFDSDKILSLNHSPKKVTVIGAGVIGCEYASS
jgi:NAD(P) transhydrogenase